MRSIRAAAAAAGALVVVTAAPGISHAAAPRNRHDPCVRGGRDSCRTTGVGFYRVSRYGIRWYGDFRAAVPGRRHLFCLDLRFWYASRTYRYGKASSSPLRNRDGVRVPAARRRRIAYAIWSFGRSTRPARQAAVMLYVHSQMGDARPGELDPETAGPDVASFFRRIARAAARYAGPYRIETRLPGPLTVGTEATASIRVLSASGHPVPGVPLTLTATGVSGLHPLPRTTSSADTNVDKVDLSRRPRNRTGPRPNPSRWRAIAARITRSASSSVAPVATHPGRSG